MISLELLSEVSGCQTMFIETVNSTELTQNSGRTLGVTEKETRSRYRTRELEL